MAIDVIVVGSINRDLTIHVPRHPAAGETVPGSGHYWANGGKGANQAVAAARMGARVAMIGAVGDDDHGRDLVDALRDEGIDTAGVQVSSEHETGLAVINVDSDAENTIVVSPGANSALQPGTLADHAELISSAKVVLCQLEIPLKTVVAAAELTEGVFCLNPAPATEIPNTLMKSVDLMIPNRSELARISGRDVGDDEAVVDAVVKLGHRGRTIVTLGAEGALIVQEREVVRIPAPAVEAIDPTAAGDAFCGTLAACLAKGTDVEEAVRRGVAAGAIAATRMGAQPSIPGIEELEAFLSV